MSYLIPYCLLCYVIMGIAIATGNTGLSQWDRQWQRLVWYFILSPFCVSMAFAILLVCGTFKIGDLIWGLMRNIKKY